MRMGVRACVRVSVCLCECLQRLEDLNVNIETGYPRVQGLLANVETSYLLLLLLVIVPVAVVSWK